MDGSVVQTYLSDVLHAVSQALLAPDIIMLLAFIAYALFCIGSVIAENFSERRHFNVAMPQFLADLMAAKEDEIPGVIERSGLLNRQKSALLTVYDYRILPGDALVALIKRLVNEEESRYDRIAGRNNTAARVSPMLGLMGTLIPLGPGIQALGKANAEVLSTSLLIAFDTTVAGLVVAAVCLVIGKIRGNWYGNYMSALDSAMATMLQKIEDMRNEGKIQIKEPSNYAFLFESTIGKPKGSRKDAREEESNPWKEIENMPPREQSRSVSGSTAASTTAMATNQSASQATQAPATMPSGMPIWRSEPSTSSVGYPADVASGNAAAARQTAPIDGYVSTAETRPLNMADGVVKPASSQGTAYPYSSASTGVQNASQQAAASSPFAQQAANTPNAAQQVAGTSQDARVMGSSIPAFDPTLTDLIASPRPAASSSAQPAVSASRVTPPAQDVPMPSFLETLAASASSAEPVSVATQVSVAPQNASQPKASQGWYQPPRASSYSSAQASYNRDMPLWGTVKPAQKASAPDEEER